MKPICQAVLLGSVMVAIALLAVLDVDPASIVRFAPLALVPFVLSRPSCCARREA